MLEIPEVQTIVRQLNDSVVGKEIAKVLAAQNPHGFAWYFGEPGAYPSLLEGKRIERAEALGGMVKLYAGDARMLFNDGVNIRYFKTGAKLPPKHQLYVEFTNGDTIVCSVQMYGGLIAYPAGLYNNVYYSAAREKASPLSDAFDRGYFEAIVREAGPKISAKALLATEQRIPGLGNGAAQDILYNARVNPQSKLGALNTAHVDALYESLKSTLRAMTDAGGRDTEKNLYGEACGYRTVLSARTLPYACRRCGSGITRKPYMGGNVYFCPVCQPVLK